MTGGAGLLPRLAVGWVCISRGNLCGRNYQLIFGLIRQEFLVLLTVRRQIGFWRKESIPSSILNSSPADGGRSLGNDGIDDNDMRLAAVAAARSGGGDGGDK